jgi:hypothetical protein
MRAFSEDFQQLEGLSARWASGQRRFGALSLILRRVRQRSLVIVDPSEIAGIKPSAALVAFEEVLALVQRRSADALADDGPTRSRLIDWHDRGHVQPRKKIRPGLLRARSDRAAITDLYRHDDRRCQTGLISDHEQSPAPSQRELGSGEKSCRGMIWTLLP